ncbi:MAG: metal-sulfur cluster assembly factor [Kiritimatiellae bacterium]|nr:metal-sulfur cluster assembly factor [Kiritimatiellia bacterium]MCO5062467.1 metal-sulfur cluster assembly factor [Kiritimatiellia bacterium]MCO5068331.1 metal-sulfur cluster assembly factor [Kiritimatiellia bacterium]
MNEEQPTPPQPDADGSMPGDAIAWSSDQVREALRVVIDPDLHINIVDLGLIYDVHVSGETISVHMTLTSPGCPYGPYLIHQVKDTCLNMKGIADAKVTLVWEPPWGPEQMSEEARLELGFDV